MASIYYSQPLLGDISAELHASPSLVAWIPTATQLGYAAGLLLLGPLSDRFDRRSVILVKLVALLLALLFAAASHSVWGLIGASVIIGLTATAAQSFVGAAATVVSAPERGRMLGTVMTGLLLGIMGSRVLGGAAAEPFGWRGVFVMAAVSVAAIAVATWRTMPRFAIQPNLRYAELLRSLDGLWRAHLPLRRAALAQGMLAVGFSAFWSTLAVMLRGEPFHLGGGAAGAFGLAGALGASVAVFTGRIADQRGPLVVVRLGATISWLAFLAMLMGTALPVRGEMATLVVATVVFNLGIQSSLIAHQSIVYGLDDSARSRINVVLMTIMFVGMASGSALGGLLLARQGWAAVMALAAMAAAVALAIQKNPP